MDEQYVKMCKEAKEIQESWKPKPGDYVYNPYPSIHADSQIDILIKAFKEGGEFKFKRILLKEDSSYLGVTTVETELPIKKRFKWLPTQKDLQEIYSIKNGEHDYRGSLEAMLEDFFLFVDSPDTDIPFNGSMDKMWLEFVMDYWYGKEWNQETEKWEA